MKIVETKTMTPEEIKEYEQTKLRVVYNNGWPAKRWQSPLQEELLKRMDETGQRQVFYPIVLDENKAVDILFKDAKLNRLVSTLLDLYDELLLRPDAAFDISWRALEIVILFYLKEFYPQALNGGDGNKPVSVEHKIKCMTNSVFEPQLNKCQSLKNVFDRIIDNDISWSVMHYIVARMFLPGELQVNTQLGFVSTRVIDILGLDMYNSIKTKYVEDNNLTADNHRNAERLIGLIIKGKPVTILDRQFNALSLQTRITFLLSGILYSSRCERFHGDFFSPLKSDRSTLQTYYGQYWLLTVSYMFFWMAVHKYLEKKGEEPFFSLEQLADCINNTIEASSFVMVKH